MRSTIQNSHKLQFALAVFVAVIICATTAQANTRLTLTFDPSQPYSINGATLNVGPYPITLGPAGETLPTLWAFCLDDTKSTTFTLGYDGTTRPPSGPQEEEAAFLAAYSLYLGAPSSNATFVNAVEGPISMAIWEIMGKLGQDADPKAQPYIQLAVSAYNDNLITPTFLAGVSVFTPTLDVQPFITAVRDDTLILSAIPEPGTWIFLATGVTLMALGRRRRPRV